LEVSESWESLKRVELQGDGEREVHSYLREIDFEKAAWEEASMDTISRILYIYQRMWHSRGKGKFGTLF
jgi:hypothetical protein